MGFLSAYEGTEKIDLGRGYWCEVKKCLSAAEMGFVEEAMGSGRQKVDVSNGGRQFAELDIRASWTEMVVQSLAAWNLDDDDGTPWPLGNGVAPPRTVPPDRNPYPPGCPRRQSVDRLPDKVFKQIWQQCDELNSPQAGPEAAQFPGEDERGGADGDAGAAGSPAVPGGAGVLEAAGLEPGDAAGPPAP